MNATCSELSWLPSSTQETRERFAKLQKARRQAQGAYPNRFKRTHRCASLKCLAERSPDPSALNLVDPIRVCGRIRALRRMGKLQFIRLEDDSGKIQLWLSENELGAEAYRHWKGLLDLGDMVGAEGTLCRTQTGELTLRVRTLMLLAKSLLPLPEKHHGLEDAELRQRKRHLDLICHPHVRERFKLRSKVIHAIRDYLAQEGFMEVETPMMHPIPGGAAARPFQTHHNALGTDLYLRIAPELYLKRLVVGGFERVYELNRNFRNEGLSTRHNPEFTMLEFYEAYSDFQGQMARVEALLRFVVERALGEPRVGHTELSAPFSRITFLESLQARWPDEPASAWEDPKALWSLANRAGYGPTEQASTWDLQLLLFEKGVERTLEAPTFVTHYPSAVSPLARRMDQSPEWAERFELFIQGREVANGFSELNDPQEQARVFQEQAAHLASGDLEAMHYDSDYLEALSQGLPPTGGTGIGIDRLVMWLTGAESIREVILFPTLRPRPTRI